jgi:hypothetical protein|tara:strand:- start:1185 stop:1439 length:255 start_codon:yes stop_codon:yes gene_type:complete
MKDKVYWTMRNGHKIDVDDMDTNHLRNTLKMLIRRIDALNMRRATRRDFVVNGEMAQEHADNYEIYRATGMLPEDFQRERWDDF